MTRVGRDIRTSVANPPLFDVRDRALTSLKIIGAKIRNAVLTPEICTDQLAVPPTEVANRDLSEKRWAWGQYLEPLEKRTLHVGLFGTCHAIHSLIICNKFGYRADIDSELIEYGKNWLEWQLTSPDSYTKRNNSICFAFLPKISHLAEALCIGDHSRRKTAIELSINLLTSVDFVLDKSKWVWISRQRWKDQQPHPIASSLVLRALMNNPEFILSNSFEDGIRWISSYLLPNSFQELKSDVGAYSHLLNTVYESPIPVSNSILRTSKDFLLEKVTPQTNTCWSDAEVFVKDDRQITDGKKLDYHLNRTQITLKAIAHLDILQLSQNVEIRERLDSLFQQIENGGFFSSPSECEIYPPLAMCLLLQTIIDEVDRHEDYLRLKEDFALLVGELDKVHSLQKALDAVPKAVLKLGSVMANLVFNRWTPSVLVFVGVIYFLSTYNPTHASSLLEFLGTVFGVGLATILGTWWFTRKKKKARPAARNW